MGTRARATTQTRGTRTRTKKTYLWGVLKSNQLQQNLLNLKSSRTRGRTTQARTWAQEQEQQHKHEEHEHEQRKLIFGVF
jgi:hypothetical protein